jgi:type IV fimbrial biogenesis protein FimT
MLTLAIISIILGLAAPALGERRSDTRLSSRVNELAGYLNYARSEAIKSNQFVNVCKSPDGNQCDFSAEWEDGWLVFVDSNQDRQRDSGEEVLKVHKALEGNIHIHFGAFYSSNYVRYYPNGRSPGNGTFTFCDARGGDKAHALVIYRGRLRTARTMPDGSPLSCSE